MTQPAITLEEGGDGAPAGVMAASAPGLVSGFRRRPFALGALIVLGLIVVSAIAAPLIAPYQPNATDLNDTLAGPSGQHLLGTDELGRDILSRLIYGARPALLDTAEIVIVAVALAVALGLIAGVTGGWIDRLFMRLVDIGLAFPVMVIILAVLSVFQGDLQITMLMLGVLLVPPLARNIRSAALAVRGELFIDAARVAGLTTARIVFRHVLPRVRGTIIVQATLVAALGLLFTTGLAYLGFGSAPPNPSWGSMTAEAAQVLSQSPWLLVGAGGITGITVLCLGVVGDTVRDVSVERWAGSAPRRARPGRRTPQPVPDACPPGPGTLLSVRGLSVTYLRQGREVTVAREVNFDIRGGETVGLVGESSCGKTSVARALIGLLRGGGRVSSGTITFDGRDVTGLPSRELARFRGSEVALISQEPSRAALDPTHRIGSLLAEAVRKHDRCTRRAARRRVAELLAMVSLPDPQRVMRLYPHEVSGGMAQRVAIARALAGQPRLLIADEPTTALDVTVQSQILDLLRSIQQSTGMAILLVTHDWGVVAASCDRAVVMYAGEVVEKAPVLTMFGRPAHPYTTLLLAANPGLLADDGAELPAIPGLVPPPEDWPDGCHFAARCPLAAAACTTGRIPVGLVEAEHESRCVRIEDVRTGAMTP